MDKTMIKTTNQSSQMEACQNLLSLLNMNESDNEMCRMMDILKVGDNKKKLEHEDLSYWDELEILNEDDFSSPEEQVSLLIAEKILMDQMDGNKADKIDPKEDECQEKTNNPDTSNAAKNSSLDEGKLTSGINPMEDQFQTSGDECETNQFLNTEYSKLMEILPDQEDSSLSNTDTEIQETSQGEDQTSPEENSNKEDPGCNEEQRSPTIITRPGNSALYFW